MKRLILLGLFVLFGFLIGCDQTTVTTTTDSTTTTTHSLTPEEIPLQFEQDLLVFKDNFETSRPSSITYSYNLFLYDQEDTLTNQVSQETFEMVDSFRDRHFLSVDHDLLMAYELMDDYALMISYEEQTIVKISISEAIDAWALYGVELVNFDLPDTSEIWMDEEGYHFDLDFATVVSTYYWIHDGNSLKNSDVVINQQRFFHYTFQITSDSVIIDIVSDRYYSLNGGGKELQIHVEWLLNQTYGDEVYSPYCYDYIDMTEE
ncbi:MAG: hypothetical protein AB7S88_05415 [Candidatus Izemoplasmatales bacterium]